MLIRLVDGISNVSWSNGFHAVVFINYCMPDSNQLFRLRMPARPKIATARTMALARAFLKGRSERFMVWVPLLFQWDAGPLLGLSACVFVSFLHTFLGCAINM